MNRKGPHLSVTDGAERLQVVQGALSSPSEHRPDVVHLPEVPFPGGSDHFVELQPEQGQRFVHTQQERWGLCCVVMFTQQSQGKYIRMTPYSLFCEQEKASRLAI